MGLNTHRKDMKKHMFSSELPRCVVEESWAAWQASRLEAESADSSKEKTPQETKRVCLFTEEELKQPVPARKKSLRQRAARLFLNSIGTSIPSHR